MLSVTYDFQPLVQPDGDLKFNCFSQRVMKSVQIRTSFESLAAFESGNNPTVWLDKYSRRGSAVGPTSKMSAVATGTSKLHIPMSCATLLDGEHCAYLKCSTN